MQRLRRRQAGLDQQRQLRVQGKARHIVGAGHDRHAGAVHDADEIDHPGIRFFVALRLVGRDLHGADRETALDVGRHVVGKVGVWLVDVAVALLEESERRQGRVDRDLFFGQLRHEILDRLRVEVEVSHFFGRQHEAVQVAGFGVGLGKEIEHHLVDVLDFVVAGVERLLGAQAGRHVAGNAHATAVRIRHGVLEDIFRERVIDLQLRVAALGIPVDGVFGALEVLDQEAATGAVRAFALQKAGGHHLRRQQLAGGGFIEHRLQLGIVVAHVAHAGHAGGDIQRARPAVDVAVHVEQARQHDTAAGVDDVFRRARGRAGRQHGGNASAQQVDIGRLAHGGLLAVEHAGIAHHAQAVERVLQPGGDIGEHLRLGRFLTLGQVGDGVLPALFKHGQGAGDDHREQARLLARGGPVERRRQADAGQRQQLHGVLFAVGVGHLRRFQPGLRQRAGRQQRNLAVFRCSQRGNRTGHHFERTVERHIAGRRGQRGAALVGGGGPLGHIALARKALVHHGAVRGIALDLVFGHQQVGAEAELFGQLGTAAVVLVGEAHGGAAVVLALDHLFAHLLVALVEDEEGRGRGGMGAVGQQDGGQGQW